MNPRLNRWKAQFVYTPAKSLILAPRLAQCWGTATCPTAVASRLGSSAADRRNNNLKRSGPRKLRLTQATPSAHSGQRAITYPLSLLSPSPTPPVPTSITKMGFFSNSSNRAPKQASLPNPLIGAYTHLSSMERADEAIKILYQLASFVKPIMQKRNWKVGTLAEFLPDYHALQGPLPCSASLSG